jgi:exodeoxyribonuclease I
MEHSSPSKTLFVYDLETSGINPREARIMQFAGVRTDLELKPIEEPHNYLIKMSEDMLPNPDAVLITGITPQQTVAEGYSEAEFLKIFYERISLPGTVFLGYNTVRFDDEFMRFLNYRNFYDPYEWQYKDDRSRWDLLDVVRMTRALRPDGINWPVDAKGNPTNRLELLTRINKLNHENAHDALSDVQAVIALATMIRNKQPKLFDYLFEMRDKRRVAALVSSGQPFLYSSGKYASEFEKTTIVATVKDLPNRQGSLVFDLRYDPEPFSELQPAQLAEAWRTQKNKETPRLPVKTLKYNRCPAIAPLGVLDEASKERLKIDLTNIQQNFSKLQKIQVQFANKLMQATEILEEKRQTEFIQDDIDVDARLYEGFFADGDKTKMSVVRAAKPEELKDLELTFKDTRLRYMLPLYKARNYPQSLTDEDRVTWEKFRQRKLMSGGVNSRLGKYLARLGQLDAESELSSEKRYLLQELQLYAQSIAPADIE